MAARILVIRFSSIGDILLTTPVLRCISRQFEGGAEIHYLTKQSYREVIEGNPYVHQLHTINESVQEVLPELEKIGFDYIIDLHRNIRTSIIRRRLKLITFSLNKMNFRKWCMVNVPFYHGEVPHIVVRYLDTLKTFGVTDDGGGLDYVVAASASARMMEARLLPEGPFVAWSIGGAHAGKRMGTAGVIAVLKKTMVPVVLLGGKAESEMGRQIQEAIPQVINLSGQLSLSESAAVLQRAAVVVSGDTGLMHLAAALSRPMVSLWGCTTPSLGMSAWRPHPESIILEPSDRRRRPCSKLGNRCKYGSERCIDHLKSDEVVSAIEKLWALQTMP
ncbi:MAG: glycosyltransferase family 9 protein [Flavobacteriales bacterium]|nr:glycosyltransferase family 9 protein [Flavobacteriales bacterium]